MKWLFSWEVVSWVVGGLVATAFAFLAMDDFKLAKLCFLLAAADAIGGMAMWGLRTDVPAWMRIGIVFVGSGLMGVLAVQSLRYVDGKKEAKEAKQGQSEEARLPQLYGQLVRGDWVETPDNRKAVLLQLKIGNNGADSVVTGYSLIISNDAAIYETTPFAIPENFTIHLPGQTKVTFRPTDAIYEKTSIAVKRGEPKNGPAYYILDIKKIEAIGGIRDGTKITIRVFDYLEKPYDISVFAKPASAGDFKLVPGTGGTVSSDTETRR